MMFWDSVYWKDNAGNDESFWDHEWGKVSFWSRRIERRADGGEYNSTEPAFLRSTRTVTALRTSLRKRSSRT